MKLKQIIEKSKLLCKIDLDETEFDALLKTFINDTLMDIYITADITYSIKAPIIKGEVTIDEGLKIIRTEPPLNDGDSIVGKTIYTTHKGVLDIYVSEEAKELVNEDDEPTLQDYLVSIIPLNVTSLWYGYKKKVDLSSFWNSRYEMEKYKRFDTTKAEETYLVGLPYLNLF